MPKVMVLPDHIASQIAAGEVVERPASVVKELVENSLDAGASQIEVTVGSDCRSIRIADNGCGMDPADAALAFQRHATSKIRSVDDLWRLTSLGFRGEALPSIASVSKVTCLTRTHKSPSGCRLETKDGKLACAETGCAPGTVMEIDELFYNVPARLSFLKRAQTEMAHIQETLQNLAIAHPEVSFLLFNSGNTLLRTKGSGDLAQVAVEAGLFTGNESLAQVSFEDKLEGLSVRGLVARPLNFRGDRKGILSLVNRRPVRCPLTYKALDYAFSDLIPRGRHPLAVIAIEVDPRRVDVNVHPTKREVKYANGNEVYLAIQRALMQALRPERTQAASEQNPEAKPVITSVSQLEETAYARAEQPTKMVAEVRTEHQNAHQISFTERLAYAPEPDRIARASMEWQLGPALQEAMASEDQRLTLALPPNWRIAGYIHNTYIIIETSDGMLLVEQHIAHERTLYERILASQAVAGRIADHSQHLLVAQPLELTAVQQAVLEQHGETLARLGFEFEFGRDGGATCVQLPVQLAHKNYGTAIQEMLEELSTTDGANIELEATKSVACQSAIKNGMPLGHSEIEKLLADWLASPRNDTCPHGRPVVRKFTAEKLFQLFHPA